MDHTRLIKGTSALKESWWGNSEGHKGEWAHLQGLGEGKAGKERHEKGVPDKQGLSVVFHTLDPHSLLFYSINPVFIRGSTFSFI